VELYPAVDVQGGRVARQGPDDPRRAPAYAGDPLAIVRQFACEGARWVHFVDLDRAFGRGANRALTRRLLARAGLPVQVGGALGGAAAITELLDWGATRVVLGTQAAADAALVDGLLGRHGAERVAIGIDARGGQAAPRGGAAVLALSALELATRLRAQGAQTVIYTDVARDGRLAGPDVDGARAIADLGLAVIASGGVASLDDLRRVRAAGLDGVVVGRALYEGRFTVAEALACCTA